PEAPPPPVAAIRSVRAPGRGRAPYARGARGPDARRRAVSTRAPGGGARTPAGGGRAPWATVSGTRSAGVPSPSSDRHPAAGRAADPDREVAGRARACAGVASPARVRTGGGVACLPGSP